MWRSFLRVGRFAFCLRSLVLSRKFHTLNLTFRSKTYLFSVISCPESSLNPIEYDKLSDITLEYLTEALEDMIDKVTLKDFDVSLAGGVLTVCFGSEHGTYVLNKQSSSKQIWFSSPVSGPKRFDYDPTVKSWIYRQNNADLFELFSDEISNILASPTTFLNPHRDYEA